MSNLPPPYRIQRLSRILFWFGLIACALFGLAAASFLAGCAYTDARISVAPGSGPCSITQTTTTSRPVDLQGLNQAAIGDAAIGALAGGAAGSVVPGVGTAAGAAAGAATGAIVGDTSDQKDEKDRKDTTTPAPVNGGG
jgi:outer membrane lipoprotein SlyB